MVLSELKYAHACVAGGTSGAVDASACVADGTFEAKHRKTADEEGSSGIQLL
jgi:hypothetical protein